MELSSEPEWLLLQILGWKARPICPFGQAIELWVCVQRCVCVGGLTWSRMGYILAPAAGGRQQRQEGGERAQERQTPHAWILVQINFIHVRAFR